MATGDIGAGVGTLVTATLGEADGIVDGVGVGLLDGVGVGLLDGASDGLVEGE